MIKKMRVLTLCMALLAGGMTQTGCAVFGKMFKKKKSPSTLRREKRAAQAKVAKATYDKISKQKGCDGVKEGYTQSYSYAVKGMERRTKTAIHLAKCGHWDMVFRKLAKSNQRFVNHMMDGLVAANLPVHKEYNKWISTANHPYKGAVGWYTFTWTRKWLSKASNPKQHCKAFWNNVDRVTNPMYPQYRSKVRSMMIGYLFMANCRSYHGKIVSLLTSNSWKDRNQACHFMKDWGKRSDLRKVRIIANTDPYSYIRRRVRIYPVRSACRAAFGRIQMRN